MSSSTSLPSEDSNILELIIDGKKYLFKLSQQQDETYLRKLAEMVEQKILENKKLFSIKDYQKLLLLTCLNFCEDIFRLKEEIKTKKDNQKPTNNPTQQSLQQIQLIDRLETIHKSLSPDSNRLKN